jgi:hypothetical protein
MKEDKPISMKKLNENEGSKMKTIAITIVMTVLFMLSAKTIYDISTAPAVSEEYATTITLDKIIIAYAPETKSIIFLNRNTGTVEIALSDSVSLAIFALKSGEIVADYNSKVAN